MPALTKAQKKLAQAAEDAFHRTYSIQYGEERWRQSLYPALEAPTRYAALVNGFATTKSDEVFSPEHMARLQAIVFPGCPDALSPKPLLAYQWDESEAEETFPPPQASPSNGRMTHWNLDAASLLAVTALNPKPGDKVLDLCAAPGGKSIAISQFLRPHDFDNAAPTLAGGRLYSNEVNAGRNKRLAANLQSYLPEALFQAGEVKILRLDGTETQTQMLQLPSGLDGYDKVLLDAPCSSERHVIHAHARARQSGNRIAEEMASWRSGQSKKMAKTQAALLMTALRAARVGGRVLYATCSLSDEENDGVVEKVAEMVQKERKKSGIRWDFVVKSAGDDDGDDELAVRGFSEWAERTRRGWLVLPDHPGGGKWGPLFFALIEKVEA